MAVNLGRRLPFGLALGFFGIADSKSSSGPGAGSERVPFAICYLLFAILDEPRRVRLSATGGISKKCSDGLLYVAHHRSA